MDDATLVERCSRGDGLAWEALVRRYQARVFGMARHYLRESDEARDMAQEIFIRVYQRLDTFEGGERFLPWLLRLSRNACIDRLRRRKARPPLSDVPAGENAQIADPGPGPEQAAEADACKRLLHRALATMTEVNREMILLKEIHGLKLEEIARMLGLPLGTVKSRSNRARIELAARVREIQPSYGASG